MVAPSLVASDMPARSSQLDHNDPAARDAPVTCGPGDLERQPGRSRGEVFGTQWPTQRHPRPVAAIRVDATGKRLHTQPTGASTDGYDNAARRLAMRIGHKPARINGRAATSLTTWVARFAGGAR